MSAWVWDVSPEIFSLGPIRVRWYGLLFALGFVLGYQILVQIYRHEGREEENLSSLLLYLVVGTIVGARLGHTLLYQPDYFLRRPWEILMIWQGGLASHGGFLGVLIALYLYLKKYKEMSFLELADRLAIPSLLAAGLIRVGNLFNSEILGRPTDLPWAIIFIRVDALPRHPAMLYEAIAYLAVFCFLYAVYWKSRLIEVPGRILGASFAISFALRFLIEFVKEEQVPFEQGMPINMGQLLSIPFILAGLFLLYRKPSISSQSRSGRKERKKERQQSINASRSH